MVSGDRWRVLLAKGEASMSLDELDAAFQDGRINADTLVKPPDARLWARLGPLAGLDETPLPWSAGVSLPVEIDVDVDLGDMPPPPRAKGRIVAAAAAVVATLGIVAFIASGEDTTARVASVSKSAANAMVIATPPPPPPPAPPPVVASLASPAPQAAQVASDAPASKVKTKTKKAREKGMHAASKRGGKA